MKKLLMLMLVAGLTLTGCSQDTSSNKTHEEIQSSDTNNETADNQGTVDSQENEKNEVVEEPEEPEEIRIEVHWDGPQVNGSSMGIEACLSNPEDTSDYDHYISESGGSGSLTLVLEDMEGDYNFSAAVTNEPDFAGYILDSEIYADVYIGDTDSPVTYKMKSGYEDVWRSYTGTKLWGPFGISEGKLVDYDPSWMNVTWNTEEEEEPEEVEEEFEEEFGDVPEELYYSTVEIPDEDLYYFGSLIGTVDYSYTPCIEYVDAMDGYLAFSGYLFASEEDTGSFSDANYDLGYCSYRVPIAADAEFSAGGGTGEPRFLTLDEFIELAQSYNGLSLILRVEDGVLVSGWIRS